MESLVTLKVGAQVMLLKNLNVSLNVGRLDDSCQPYVVKGTVNVMSLSFSV